ARENGVWIKVVRNTLARRALKGTPYECLAESFVGPTTIAFSREHPGAGARILQDFAKENDQLEMKVDAYEGELVNIGLLARLPTYNEAVAKLVFVLKEAADGNLVRTLAAVGEA